MTDQAKKSSRSSEGSSQFDDNILLKAKRNYHSPLFEERHENAYPSQLKPQSLLPSVAWERVGPKGSHQFIDDAYLLQSSNEDKQKNFSIELKKSIQRFTSCYHSFIRNNRQVLHYMESILSRMILYSQSFREKSGGSETYYAILNLWTIYNDFIYYQYETESEDMTEFGFPSGTAQSSQPIQLSTKYGPNQELSNNSLRSRLLFYFRFMLSSIDCLEPSIEMPAYFSGEKTRLKNGHKRALQLSRKIEQIKFCLRLVLLSITYSTNVRQWVQASKNENGQLIQNCLQLSKTGILQNGGILESGERFNFKDENYRLQTLLYKGDRTDKRLHLNFNAASSRSRRQEFSQGTSGSSSSSIFNHRYFGSGSDSPIFRFGLLIMGELLHIYRPLYWICKYHDIEMDPVNVELGNRSEKIAQFKAWLVSLMIDVLSHKMTTMSMSIKSLRSSSTKDMENISCYATKTELRRRKLRWALYLLRAPIWSLFTRKVTNSISRVVSVFLPIMGVPIAAYTTDLLEYWQKWHFSLE